MLSAPGEVQEVLPALHQAAQRSAGHNVQSDAGFSSPRVPATPALLRARGRGHWFL